jgi:hypothetical protein
MNSQEPAMSGIGRGAFFELPEQLSRAAPSADKRTKAMILLIDIRHPGRIRAETKVKERATRTCTVITLVAAKGSGRLWHPAKRKFVNGALKFDELGKQRTLPTGL